MWSLFLIEVNAAISISNRTSDLHNIFPPGLKGNATRKQAISPMYYPPVTAHKGAAGNPAISVREPSRISIRTLVPFHVVMYAALFGVMANLLQATSAYG
jgi:hypothetical protein